MRGEGACPLGITHQSLANLSELRVGGVGGRVAGFGVHEDSGDDSLQIATHAGAVVFKDLGDAVDVGGTRIARHQVLDQLLGEKRGQIGMIEKRVESDFEIAGGIGAA